MSGEYSFIAEGGLRLDRFIAEKCPGISRTYAQKLIESGLVTVNGRKAKPSLKPGAGERVEITVPTEPVSELMPEPIPLKIVYEDDDVFVVDKPPHLVVHPAPGHPSGTLVNAILGYLPQLAEGGGALRPGIVHRLDKDTSGLILIAKNRLAHEKLAAQFKSHAVNKYYLVLVQGTLTPERGVIEAPVGRDPHRRKRMAVVVRGREASTEYRVLKYIGGYTLLEIKPRTGRTHQIRVHLSAIGFPVVGDATYGVTSPYVPRQFLHASRLGFYLPSSGEYAEFTSPLPPDLARALELIG